ncbi:hypothetical protein AB6D11_02535 [Vibrio splendidus]
MSTQTQSDATQESKTYIVTVTETVKVERIRTYKIQANSEEREEDLIQMASDRNLSLVDLEIESTNLDEIEEGEITNIEIVDVEAERKKQLAEEEKATELETQAQLAAGTAGRF